jgi:hypothetical protein
VLAINMFTCSAENMQSCEKLSENAAEGTGSAPHGSNRHMGRGTGEEGKDRPGR